MSTCKPTPVTAVCVGKYYSTDENSLNEKLRRRRRQL